ncbi:esterase [Streptomyces laurentii]|uniref:Esterase n=1 Tax=Streptomyces laurentii TaxID=39478 RepID=A0A160P123_STRLU|nr:esterase [Streptomyces laurentii]
MKKRIRLGLVIAAVGVGTALAPTASPAAAATLTGPTLRVLPLGDSITAGVGSPTASSYRRPLLDLAAGQSRYNVRFVGSQVGGRLPDISHEGHSGYMIDDIRNGIDQWMAGARPDVVLLHIGVNDLDRSDDPGHAGDRLKALLDQIYADKPGVTVIMQGVVPTIQGLKLSPEVFNDQARQLQSVEAQAGNKFRFVDAPALDGSEMADELHPNDKGYDRMARTFFTPLDEAFTSGWATGGKPPNAANESGVTGRVRFADFDGDGRADYLTVASNGAVSVWLNRGGDGRGDWEGIGQVATGTTNDRDRVRFADFDGDGKADYIVLSESGAVSVWLNRGGDGRGDWQWIGQVATGTTSDQSRVRFADYDGDGKADYIHIKEDGSVHVYLNRGGDGRGDWQVLGQVATGITKDQSRVRFADFDGDGRADYAALNEDGSVHAYLNRGGDGRGGWQDLGRTAVGLTTDQSRVGPADFDGDGHADYVLTDPVSNAVYAWTWNGGDGRGDWRDLGRVAAGVPIG